MIDYAKKIEQAKQEAVKALNSEINKMESSTYNIMLKVIDDTFDVKAGSIVEDKDFVDKLNQMTADVINLIQKAPEFKGPVSKFVKRMDNISDGISSFQQQVNGITVPAFETAKNTVIDETINQMLGNGLNQNFVQPLRNLIYQNVTSGLSLSQVKKQIKEFIDGGKDTTGKLHRYIDQTAQQAVDSYSGAINKKLLEIFNYNGLLITGSLIDTSSPQCRYAIKELNGKITRDNWSDVVDHVGVKYPLIPGTTFDNVPINRLHWGCRHSFYPIIIKEEVKPELSTVDQIKLKNKTSLKKLLKKGYELDEDIAKHMNPKVKIKVGLPNQSYYEGSKKTISIQENPLDEFFKKKVMVHEQGHAWHFNEKIITQGKVDKKFKKIYLTLQSSIKGKENYIEYSLENLLNRYPDLRSRQELTAFYDTLMGLTKGRYGKGHPVNYMEYGNNSEMEVFAHAVEFYKLKFNLYDKLPIEIKQVYDTLANYIKEII